MVNKQWTNSASASRCTITRGEDYEVVCTVKDVETAELIVKAVNQNDRFEAALDKLSEGYAYCVILETQLKNITEAAKLLIDSPGMDSIMDEKTCDLIAELNERIADAQAALKAAGGE